MDMSRLHAALLEEVRMLRRPDGGLSTSVGGASETEPTTVASLALRDGSTQAWLTTHQARDGGFATADGRPEGPAVSTLASLALEDGAAARRSLGYAIARRGLPPPDSSDPEHRTGWGWTPDARSTVEPTSRVLLAVNRLTPSDHASRREAIGLLVERHCADGGWNYGNASVNDVDLRGYAQTTAVALLGLQGGPASLVEPGMRFLKSSWRREPGGLTAAQALAAFRLHGLGGDATAAVDRLATISRTDAFRARPLAVAWAALATGPDELLDRLRRHG
jgi:hypothetical protein